ncbi:origin recognition complex subunit 1-like [Amphibalanus amphitrite]|uniref:origin recognition complex subunit 1-like n=1 Tax=Amphibalanus amphitrite TaxID=1232801 RepID=UPI001C90BA68|nr:origin recognition complex subunit 1-like [Amphibalanus amphitrite]
MMKESSKKMTYIQNGKKITWLEEDPSPPTKVTRISKTYYRSCKFGNLRLAVGDFVLIADLSAGDEDHVDGCEIAEITHMYDTGDPDEKDPCWLTVRWFTRWDLLPPTVRKKLPVGLPQPHPTREVVLDGRPFSPEVLISTVWDKCEVRVLQPYEDSAVERSTRGALELFVTRFQLQTKPLKLVSISGLDLGFEDEGERKRTKTPQKTGGRSRQGSEAPERREKAGDEPRGRRKREGSETPGRQKRAGSKTPERRRRERSETPGRCRRETSETPRRRKREGSETPGRQKRAGSETPGKRRRDRSETPGRQIREVSKTPGKQKRTGGETPAKQKRAGSETPGKQKRAGSEAPGETPTAERRTRSTGKENNAPTTPSQQPPSKEGLSRSGRRRKERSYRDLVEGKAPGITAGVGSVLPSFSPSVRLSRASCPPGVSYYTRSSRASSQAATTSWEDEDAITISYTSPKMVMKMSRLTDSKIRQMLLEDDDSDSSLPDSGRSTPVPVKKKTPRASRETTPARGLKRTASQSKTDSPARARPEPSRSRGATPVKRDASRTSTPSKPEPSRSRGATPVKRDASRASTPSSGGARSAGRGTPRSAGRGSASPSAGRSTPRSARRSLCLQPSLATVTEERSPGAASARPSDPPPARRLFAADAGGAKRRRLSLAVDSENEEEEEVAPRRGGGRSRAASARRTEELPEESSQEEEWTPVKRRTGRAAASPATPSRGRGRGRGGRSVTASPRTPKVGGTPLVPGRSAGCLDTPGTPLERARSRLHVAAVPEALPCRENEFLDIYTFVEARLLDGTGGCMYVSGVPGTGKTATMREVVRSLQEGVQTGDLPAFQFIEVNGMRLTEPQRAYCQILSELTGTKAVPEHAAQMLDKRFSQPAGRRQPLLLMVDELDLLWTRKQNVLYNLFDWPSRPHARLIVVAIANTMDLPERIMMNRVSSRLGLTRMTFQPYTFKQLQEIVSSRLSGLDAFDPDAIQLVARKVAAVSGDARRALDICRRATELAERGPAAERRHMSPRKAKTSALVAMEHVNAAIQEMFASPKIVAIRSCPAQARSLLQAVVSEFQRTGLEEARLGRVYEQMAAACRFEGVSPPTLSEVFALVSQLTAVRLLHAQHARHDLETRLRLNISVDDVSYAVQEMPDL